MPITYCLIHDRHEGPGLIKTWSRANDYTFKAISVYNDVPMPNIGPLDLIVVMGGPMNIYEEVKYPWLAREKAFLTQCIKDGNQLIGICLGAQLLAERLGATVTTNGKKEIGWYDIEWTDKALEHPYFSGISRNEIVFHWHGDTFSIPPEAIHLATSKACKNQGFLWREQVLGLQFHPEITASLLEEFIQANRNELKCTGPFIQTAGRIKLLSEKNIPDRKALFSILDRFTHKR